MATEAEVHRFVRHASMVEEIQRLGRFLLLSRPEDAEHLAQPPPELREILENKDGVLRLEDPDGSVGYIVVNHGMRRTLEELPPGYDPTEIRTARAEADEPILQQRLQELVATLEKENPDPRLYDLSAVHKMLEAIASYGTLDDEVVDQVLLSQVLPEGFRPGHVVSDQEAMGWAESALESMLSRFSGLQIPGDVAVPARAACWLILKCAAPGAVFNRILPQLPRGRRVRRSRFVQVPTLSAGLIIALLEDLGHRGTVCAWNVACSLQEFGNGLRRQADSERRFLEFHRGLHWAYLSYVSAEYLLDILLHEPFHDIPRLAADHDEMREHRDTCEEMRVIIANSFLSAIAESEDSLNITRFPIWEAWLTSLRRLPIEEALDAVDDVYLRMAFPRICHEIARMVVRLDHAPDDQKALAAALRVARRWALTPDDELKELRLLQTASLTSRIARAYRRLGQAEEADRWSALISSELALQLNHVLDAIDQEDSGTASTT